MADVIAVGHGSVLGFSTFAAAIRSIGSFTQDREAVDAGHLGMVGFTKKVPAGLAEPGSVECEFLFNPGTTAAYIGYEVADPTGAVAAATITFPTGANTTSAGKVVSNAFCVGFTSPELTSDGLMTGTITLQWEGGSTTAMVWTPAVA